MFTPELACRLYWLRPDAVNVPLEAVKAPLKEAVPAVTPAGISQLPAAVKVE